jgi:hypothetical protein
MDANRRAAVTAGVLVIIATVASLAGTALSGPIANDPDRLTRAAANASLLTGGALLQLLAAGASVSVTAAESAQPAAPTARRQDHGPALLQAGRT